MSAMLAMHDATSYIPIVHIVEKRKKENEMRLIDADALIEKCGDWYVEEGTESGFIGTLKNLLATMSTIQAEKAQLSCEGTTSDLISRQAAIDIGRNATVDTNPLHFEAHQKFTQFMDDAEVSSFGRWQWANGFNTALTAVRIDLKKLPSIQPERKKGRWLPDNNSVYEMRFICSECKESEVVPTIGFTKYKPIWDFCPNCGADMRGEQHETD